MPTAQHGLGAAAVAGKIYVISGGPTPSAVAVLRLIISSTFVACCTGRSAGFSPLRIRPV